MVRALIRAGGGLFAIAALAGLVATSAGAVRVSGEQYSVSGKQTPRPRKEDTFRMSGGLIGDWKLDTFKTLAVKPVYRAKGTETFDGCIDVKRDGSCAGDPSGTMRFSFRYWAQLDQDGKVQLGTCSHPVTGGSGDFADASGLVMMVDTPIKKPPFTVTHYQGTITLSAPLSPVPAMAARTGSPPSPC
jgi:hypothetical protein